MEVPLTKINSMSFQRLYNIPQLWPASPFGLMGKDTPLYPGKAQARLEQQSVNRESSEPQTKVMMLSLRRASQLSVTWD